MEASARTRQKTLGRGSFPLAVAAALLMLTACAVQKPFHFHFAPRNISKISYNPKNCVEMPDGTFKCKDVIFTVGAVDIPPEK